MRGKARTLVEFGAKLSVSLRDGYVFLDRIDWDNFNESGDFKAQVEAFKEATGLYPDTKLRSKSQSLNGEKRSLSATAPG